MAVPQGGAPARMKPVELLVAIIGVLSAAYLFSIYMDWAATDICRGATNVPSCQRLVPPR